MGRLENSSMGRLENSSMGGLENRSMGGLEIANGRKGNHPWEGRKAKGIELLFSTRIQYCGGGE